MPKPKALEMSAFNFMENTKLKQNERCPTYLKTKAFYCLAFVPGEAPSLSGLIMKIIPPLAG